MISAVSDAGPLIHLYESGALSLPDGEAEQFIRSLQRTGSLFVTPTVVELASEPLRRVETK